MTTSFDRATVAIGYTQLGRPYSWAARGEWAVRKNAAGLFVNVPVGDLGFNGLAFDCAGLVLWSAFRAGGPDLRGWWSADHLWKFLPMFAADEHAGDDSFRLNFYGSEAKGATHVSFDLGRGQVLEAAGGDSTTLTPADAAARPAAHVRVGFGMRGDLLGTRSLRAVARLPIRPPA